MKQKFVFIFSLSILFFLTAVNHVYASPLVCGNYGDVDGDGSVTQADSQLISNYVAGNVVLTDQQKALADVNGDKVVSISDSMYVGQYVSGVRPTFPACFSIAPILVATQSGQLIINSIFRANSGNIGIGMTNPLFNLHVNGSAKFGTLITPYAQTLVVAKSGGDYTSIQAAINSITDASPIKRYSILIMPGFYTEQIVMKSWVDVRGIGGKHAVQLHFTGNDNGTVILGESTQIEDVLIEESNVSTEWAMVANNKSQVHIRNVDILGFGANVSQGIKITGNTWSTLFIENSVINYLGQNGYGIYITGNSASPQNADAHITNTFVDSFNAVSGGSVYIADTFAARMRTGLLRTSQSGFGLKIHDTSSGRSDFLIDSSTLEWGNSLVIDQGATAYLKESTIDNLVNNGTIRSWGIGIGGQNFFVSGNIGAGTSAPREKLEVNGGILLNASGDKPACDDSRRGTFWFTKGSSASGSGTIKDNLEICAKDQSGVISWKPLY